MIDANEIAILLAKKNAIDRGNAEALNMGSYDRWIADALELLLRIAIEAGKPR